MAYACRAQRRPRSLPLGLGAFDPGLDVPAGFEWPTASQYTAALAQALSTTKPSLSSLTPALQAHVHALESTLEAASGVKLAELTALADDASALSSAADTASVLSHVSALVHGVSAVVVEVASKLGQGVEAAKVASQIAQTAGPLLSAVSAAADFAAGVLAEDASLDEQCRHRAAVAADELCATAAHASAPISSAAEGPSPADYFRVIAYWMAGRYPVIPLSPMSIFAVLGGVRSARLTKRGLPYMPDEANEIYRACVPLAAGVGLPMATRAQIAELVRTLAGSVRPVISDLVNDGGHAAFPILLEFVRNEMLAGRLTEKTIKCIGRQIAMRHRVHLRCRDLESAYVGRATAFLADDDCRRRVDLATPFVQLLASFQAAIQRPPFFVNGRWVVGSSAPSLEQRGLPKTPVLVKRPKPPAPAVVAAGTVAAGGAAYFLVKALLGAAVGG